MTDAALTYFKALSDQGINTPDKFEAWMEAQGDRDDALSVAWEHAYDLELDRTECSRWLVPAVDADQQAFSFDEELHEREFDLEADDESGHQEVMNDILDAFKAHTSLDKASLTGDLNLDWDSDGRITDIRPGVIHVATPDAKFLLTWDIKVEWGDEDEELMFELTDCEELTEA